MIINITCFQLKGKTHFHINLDDKDFDDDKEIVLNDLPMEQWFNPSSDEDVEWDGLIQEIERCTNKNRNEFVIDFTGAKKEEMNLYSLLDEYGFSYMHKKEELLEEESKDISSEDIEAQLKKAYEAYENEEYQVALERFERIKDLCSEASFMIGEIYLYGLLDGKRDYEQALKYYQYCDEQGDDISWGKIAECMYFIDDSEKECETFGWALKAYKNKSLSGTYILARCYWQGYGCKENVEKAKNMMLEIIDDTESPRDYVFLGDLYDELELYDDALEVYLSGIKKTSSIMCMYYAALYFEEGKGAQKDEYEAFRLMSEAADYSDKAKKELARYYAKGIGTDVDINRSIAILSEIEDDEIDDFSWVLEAYQFCENGENDKAIKVCRDAIANGKNSAREYLGDLLLKQGEYKEAERILRSALNYECEDEADVLRMIGDCYFLEDSNMLDYQQAEKYYVRASELGNSTAMLRLSNLYLYQNSDGDKAIEYLEKSANAGNTEAHLRFCYYLFDIGKIDEAAIKCQEHAKEGDEYACLLLGKCLIKQKKYDEAIKWLNKVGKAEVGEAFFHLACIYSEDEYIGKSKEKTLDVLESGAEYADEMCRYMLAMYYLYDEEYVNENKGIELLKILIDENHFTIAKYTLAMFYFNKYERVVSKVSIWDSEASLGRILVGGVAALFAWPLSLLQIGNLVAGHIQYRQITKKKKEQLDEDDYRAIKDMVQYMRELRKSSNINQEERQAVDKAFKKLDSKFVS